MCSRTHMPNYAVFVYESTLFNTAITQTLPLYTKRFRSYGPQVHVGPITLSFALVCNLM